MRLKFRTYSAHAAYGCAKPGQEVEVPDELAQDLIEGKYAVAVVARESEALGGGETAMHPPSGTKRRGESR